MKIEQLQSEKNLEENFENQIIKDHVTLNLHKAKIDQVMDFILDQIANQSLIEGSRLWSVRKLASRLNFSVSTVLEAYARLVAQDVIEARRGAGYFVCRKRPSMPDIPRTALPYTREVDPLWISRQALLAQPEMIKAGCGWLPQDWMPEQAIRKALKTVAKIPTAQLADYPSPHGHLGLRQWIVRKNQYYEVALDSNQVLLTDSATQSMDLIFRLYLRPGDVILIDDPCYFNFLALIQQHQLRAIAIPFTEQGPNVQQFEQALQYQPKIYLTNSGIHNPTGASLSLHTAYKVAKLAEQADLLVIEDDIFAEFEFQAAPRYASLMGLKQVIQIGSFSKSISASMRCGYIATDLHRIEQLIDLKIATSFSHSQLNAEIIFHVLNDGAYHKHLQQLKQRLLNSMNDCLQRLSKLKIETQYPPKAGLFLWCKLPQSVDAAALSKYCLAQGIILAPGQAFSQSTDARQYLRFNVAQSTSTQLFQVLTEGIQQLSQTFDA